ncbi:rhodanese-like domain-containing protein [Roseomonas sp. ROY-5-3]|uniref:Rhodanese-like domain-containing protein n=2 Tax=Acetobacterales TaxID=3120395 RepID=A0ABS6HE75_9PROT|nr:rhodanese-like domain-containing protein [Roseomonas oleicola]
MPSRITDVKPATAQTATEHFAKKFEFETDCWDVHESMRTGKMDFVLLDVRGHASYVAGHVPGALSLPHGKITATHMAEWPDDTVFVVYCAGPHCNGADRGALRLARLGRPVKLMLGGMTGWEDEGFVIERGEQAGSVAQPA